MNQYEIALAVETCLDDLSFHYEYNVEKCVFSFGLNINNKLKNLRYLIDVDDTGYTVYATCQLNADESCRNEVMKYLTMANYGLKSGNFELDLRDGEIRYKTHADCSGLETIPGMIIARTIWIPSRMFERYGNGLAALLMGFSDAETEIKKAEADL